MIEVSVDQLKEAVERQYGGTATLVAIDPVKEVFERNTVWQGKVHTFNLEGCPNATRAYAWSSPTASGIRRRFFAVLHLGGIRSPQDAVRAAIVAERKAKES